MKSIRKMWSVIQFFNLYLLDLFVSSLKIAWDVLTIQQKSNPGIVKVPLRLKSVNQITAFGNLITFSPGTMVVDLADDRSFMLIHSMFAKSDLEVIQNIQKLEQKFMEMIE